MNYHKIFFVLILAAIPFFAQADLAGTYERLYNPLPENELVCLSVACDLKEFLLLIIRDILQLLPVVSVLFIIIGAFQMVASSGNEERLIKAKKTILWAVLGLVVALLSFSLIAIVKNLLSANA